jgi:formylglycine-generating enzyme required for sulfatase activity
MVDLKDNNFDMGCDSVYYYTRYFCDGRTYISYVRPNESPKHNVTLDDYQIGKFEITNDQYCKFLNTLTNDPGNLYFGSSFQSHRQKSFPYKVITYKGKLLCLVFDMTQSLDERQGIGYEKLYDSPIMWNGTCFEVDSEFLNHPVRFMYYEGANMFANWAGQYRLPTEAEWENAAMGGSKSKGYKFSGSNNLSEVAVYLHNLCGNSTEPSTMPVGSLKPNEIGIYDMSGNVYEICSDIYSASYYSVSPRENPQNTTYSNYEHVQRGGSYNLHYDEAFRVKSRYYLAGAQLINSAGFRLAKSLNHYSVSFTITSNSGVIENATINFDDNNYAFDTNGQVTITNVSNGTYSYTISANGYVDAIGKISVSDANVNKEVNLTAVSTGDVEFMLSNNIRVYPNPSKGKFFVKYEGVATVSVYNAVGGKVIEKEMSNEIELSLQNKGLFFIILKNNKETLATKIIITN